ncbi:MAG: hypothetical protein ABIA74_01955 [bacterium]
MEQEVLRETFEQQQSIIRYLSALPHKILQFHDLDGLAQMILHELAHKPAFNLKRATYLVDNPDFDHLIGVAGFEEQECHLHKVDLWQSPDLFSNDMQEANFHNDIKKFLKNSLKKNDINLNNSQEVSGLGHFLGMKEPDYFSWNMKHGNHGILLFDKGEHDLPEWKRELLMNAAALLSLCSIL